MKSAKKPTRAQKKILSNDGLDPQKHHIVKNLLNEMHVINVETNEMKIVKYG